MTRTVEKELCEFFANEHWRAAVQEDDPEQCMMFLKLAQQWLAAGQEHEAALTRWMLKTADHARSGSRAEPLTTFGSPTAQLPDQGNKLGVKLSVAKAPRK
jgi:hypothetical protein